MATALISLGSNLGDRQATLDAAVERLRQIPGIEQLVVSAYHATKPIGGPDGQTEFLNAAARLDTSLSPLELLIELQRIERELGRVRQEHWGPRTLDLDLLLYDDLVINEPDLIVPHRFLAFRRFVLEPAVEVASEMRHPILFWRVAEVLAHLHESRNVFGIGGLATPLRRAFARRLAQQLQYSIETPHLRWDAKACEWLNFPQYFSWEGVLLATPPTKRLLVESWQRGWGIDIRYGLDDSHDSSNVKPFVWPRNQRFDYSAVFILAASAEVLASNDKRLAQLSIGELKALCEHLLELPMEFNLPPLLFLPADDLDRAVREAVAAIQAMQ